MPQKTRLLLDYKFLNNRLNMTSIFVESSTGNDTELRITPDVYSEDDKKHFIQVKLGSEDIWLTKSKATEVNALLNAAINSTTDD